MHSLLRRLPAIAVAICLLQPAMGALKVGDPAPKIKVKSWVQGEAVQDFEGDKVYIVEFWATWCGPCIAAIPHINDIYKRHKDKGLVVIGQNVMEDDDTAVSGFVKKMGAKMTYRVALDEKTGGGYMAKNWLQAAGQNGIPCAFVVSKKGKISYIGHPMSLKESMLESLLAEPSTKPAANQTGTAAATTLSPKAAELADLARTQIRDGKLDDAETTIAGLHEALADSSSDNFRHIGALMELDLLLARKQADDAIQLSKLLGEDFAGNPAVLNAVAARLVSQPDASPTLLAAAEKIATPISTADGPGRSAALGVLARIAFQRGEKSQAVKLQTQAVSSAAPAEAAAAKAILESYEQGKPAENP